jgi:energy-coupling factor transporter ATP-binding protein EcfA2
VTDLLRIRDVAFGYGNGPAVLSGASLSIAAGSVCGVLGPNGAGKSTLARLAAGVFQPRAGSVLIGGHDLRTTSGPNRARLVRVSFQTPEHELFRRTLGAELDWEAALLGVNGDEMRRRTTAMLADCGAVVPLDTHPYDLDPWQRKLFACLSALAIRGRLVILDEPTLRLGQSVRTRLGSALREYAGQGGAVMFVTHDHEFAAGICDSVAVVRGGSIEASGAASAVLTASADHAATNIYSFPSFYLDRAVRSRSARTR